MEHIRDRGNSERRAKEIQDVVGLLGQISARPVVPDLLGRDYNPHTIIERTDSAQLGYTMHDGWDAEGRYITPEH